MAEADIKQVDPAGLETLELFSEAPYFNRWMFDEIAAFCKGDLLEIGSGIGNLSIYLLSHSDKVALSDVKPVYCDMLRQKFGHDPSLTGIYMLDLAAPNPGRSFPELMEKFDSIIALNVVEHIEDHALAISNCRKLLKPGGQLILLVPAFPWLYNRMDEELGHFRRYRKPEVVALLTAEGFQVVHTRYFNAMAIVGWWITGSLLKMRKIKKAPLKWYNRLVPAMRLIDKIAAKKIGLSVIAVARKEFPR
jgi:2-polyprenyl-3-methyl-5-hydroxy-6-metoxy-1,4-benzoquinol methylase